MPVGGSVVFSPPAVVTAAALVGAADGPTIAPHGILGAEIPRRSHDRSRRRGPRAAALAQDARAARLSRADGARVPPRAPLRAAVGNPRRSARLAAVELVEAAPARRRRDARAHRRGPARGARSEERRAGKEGTARRGG